jgi:hypothetical protein
MNKTNTYQVEGGLPHQSCVVEKTYEVVESMDRQQSTLHLLNIKDLIIMQLCLASSFFDTMTKLSYTNFLNDNG